jgi:tRNA threonylcarbamoyladenosine biosynthesis protein TsaB
LESLAQGALQHLPSEADDFQIVPMIDARRMEVFAARYNRQLQLLDEVAPVIVDEDAYRDLPDNQTVVFCGNGMPKCRELLSAYPNAYFLDAPVSAKNLLLPALQKWQNHDFEDVAYFEPFYLKEYVAAKPVVKGLR